MAQSEINMSEAELKDLAALVLSMIHPEASKRVSIADLNEQLIGQVNWLKKSLYKANSEPEIGQEMHERIHSSDSFLRVFDVNRAAALSTRSEESSMSDLDSSASFE